MAGAAAASAPNVRVLGHLHDTTDLYRAADVALVSSTAESGEGYPTTSMLEAASFGVPLVMSADSGADQRCVPEGTIFAEGSAEQWISAIEAQLTSEAARLGARNYALDHDMASWVLDHCKVFGAATT